MDATSNAPDLGPGLRLRRSTRADAEALADFNARIHSDDGFDHPDPRLAAWTRDLMLRSHPSFEPDDFTLVEDTRQGRIVSACNLIDQTWSYAEVPFGVGRVELVGTLPEYRRRGLIRAQMAVLHDMSRERGQLVQAITGIQHYYRQFGYEYALGLHGGRSAFEANIPALAAGAAEPFGLRAATLEDIPFLANVYEQSGRRYAINCVFEAATWRYEIEGRSRENLDRQAVWVIQAAGGAPVGYVTHTPWLNRAGAFTVMGLELKAGVSWLAAGPSVLRRLWAVGLAVAAGGGGQLRNISLVLGGEHPIYSACASALPHGWPPYAWYLRVPDLAGFVRQMAPALEARLAASIAAGHSGTLTLSFYQDGLRLELAAGRLVSVETWTPAQGEGGNAAFPNLTFLQLLFGYRALDELLAAFPDAVCRGDEARGLLQALFPKQASNLWPIS